MITWIASSTSHLIVCCRGRYLNVAAHIAQ
jgi:hypothetical protein